MSETYMKDCIANKLDDLFEKVIILKIDPITITEKQLDELIHMSDSKITLFHDSNIINKLKCLLNSKSSNKSSLNKKVTSILHITIAVIIFKVYENSSNWPIWIMNCYLNDCMSSRIWVDDEKTNLFCKNICKTFDDSFSSIMEVDEISNESLDAEFIQDIIDISSTAIDRFSKMKYQVKNAIIQSIDNNLNGGNCSINVIQTCVNFCKIAEIRSMISKYLEIWIKNPAMAEAVRNLSKHIINNIIVDKCGTISDLDIVVLDNVIKLRQSMLNQYEKYKSMLKSAILRNEKCATYICKGLVLSDFGLANIAETAKLISSILKETQSPSEKLLGELLGEASVEYYAANGIWILQSSKIFLDVASRLLRHNYFEGFATLEFVQNFVTAISNANIPDPKNQEWLLFCIDVVTTSQLLRFNDSMTAVVEVRETAVRSSSATLAKSNFVNIKELSKSKSGLLKLSNQVKIGNTSETFGPKQKVNISESERVVILRDIMTIQELMLLWLCETLHANSNEANNDSNNSIELVQRACCYVVSPRISIDVDKKCTFLIKENGCINDKIIKTLAILALNSSISIDVALSWIDFIESIIHRALKTQQSNPFSCDIILDDVHGVLLSLFSLCTIKIISSENKRYPVQLLTDINLVISSNDDNTSINHPFVEISRHVDKRPLITLPLIVENSLYWKICRIIHVLACARPDTIGRFVWDEVPTIRNLLVMTISGLYENIKNLKNTSSDIAISKEKCTKYESKLGGEIIITENNLQLIRNVSNSCHHEEILKEFESAVWKYLFGHVTENPTEFKEFGKKREYERWEMEQEKIQLKVRRESQQVGRSVRAALRMARKEGTVIHATPEDNPPEICEKGKSESEFKELAKPEYQIFPPQLSPSYGEPYLSQWGTPAQDSIMFMTCKECARVPPLDFIKSLMNIDNKFKLGLRLRSCTEPDFISKTLVDCDEQSMSRDIKWLISAISEDLETVLQRLPFSAITHLLRMASSKVFDRLRENNVWDFAIVKETFDDLFSKNDDPFANDDHTTDMKLIAALIFKVQSLFIDYNVNQKSERNTVLHIIGSELQHEDFDRRCVCRLFLSYFFKINSKTFSFTHSFDEETRLGPINCDFLSALKTIWATLYKHNDASHQIIIDSVTKSIKNEGNIKVLRSMLHFLKWIETSNIHESNLDTKALALLLSTKPLTAKHILKKMTLEEVLSYFSAVVSSILSSSNQANGLISDSAMTDLLSIHAYESVYIAVCKVDLDLNSIFDRKRQTNIEVGRIAVRVDVLRSLLIIAILHPMSFDNLNSQLIQCALSALACFSTLDIRNFFGDVIGLSRTLKNYKYCKIILALLPIEILLKLVKHYTGFTVEFMKAFTDIIDKSIAFIELGITWDTIMIALGTQGFLKLTKEIDPLIKLLQYFSSCDNLVVNNLEEGEENVELSNLDLSPGKSLKEYMTSSIFLKHVFEYIPDDKCIASPQLMEVGNTIFEEIDTIRIIYDEDVELILSSINNYQSLCQNLLMILTKAPLSDQISFENKLKNLFVAFLSLDSKTIISIVELLNNIFILLKDPNSTTASSSSRSLAIENIMLQLGLTDNILKSDISTFGLKAHFLISFFPFNSSEDALQFLQRVINVRNDNDSTYDMSGLIFTLLHVINFILRAKSNSSLSFTEIRNSYIPKIAALLKIVVPTIVLESLDLPFLDIRITMNDEPLNSIKQLMEYFKNILNKLINLDLMISEAWVTDSIVTCLNPKDFTEDVVDIGKSIKRATLYYAYKAHPNEIIAAIQAKQNVGNNLYILHGILYHEQESFMSINHKNFFIVCSRRIYFASHTLFMAARTKKDYSKFVDTGVESASSLDHELLVAISTLSKECLDDSDTIDKYIAIFNDNIDIDNKLLRFQNCMTKSYHIAVLKLITAAYIHPVLWIRLIPNLIYDELKHSVPSSPNEKHLIICKLQTEINDKNSLLWLTIILCMEQLPPCLIYNENGIFRDLLGVNLLIYFLNANIDDTNQSSHVYTVLQLFKNSLSKKRIESRHQISMLQQYLFT